MYLTAEVVGEGRSREIDGAEVDAGLDVMRPGLPAHRVEHLVAKRPADLRRVLLPAKIGDPGHVYLRSAHRFAGARPAARRVQRAHDLVAAGDLDAQVVVDPGPHRHPVHPGDHPVAAVERPGAAFRGDPAERLDVLVDLVTGVGAEREPLARREVQVGASEQLGRGGSKRHHAGVDDESGATQDGGRGAERPRPERVGHRRGVVDRHRAAVVGRLPLDRDEVERPVLRDRSAERSAKLLLVERRLRQVHRLTGGVELLEVAAGIQRPVAQEQEGAARHLVRAALGHDVDDAPGGLAELRRIGVGQDLELAYRVLADGRAHAVHGDLVIVEAVEGDVVRPSALPGEGQT